MPQYVSAFTVFLCFTVGCLATDPSEFRHLKENQTECRCKGAKTPPSQPVSNRPAAKSRRRRHSRGALRIRIAKEPPSLLPIIDPGPETRSLTDHDVYESLVRISEDASNVEKELAVSWDVTDDLRTYIFELDPRAMWHDGARLTAEDVKYTFSRVLDPAGQTALRGKYLDVKSIDIVDHHTIIFRLDKTRPDFLFALAFVPILPAHVFDRAELATHPAARAPVGSGPFRFSRWSPGRSIVFERNPEWRGEPPEIEKLEYLIIPHTRVALYLLERGEIDIVLNIAQSLKWESPTIQMVTFPLPEFQLWIYNTSRTFFSSSKLRSAMEMLIDRDAIRCSILACRADLVEGPWQKKFSPILGYATSRAYNPKQAAETLTKTGWVDSTGDGIRDLMGTEFSFSLLLPSLEQDLFNAASVVQQDLDAVGVKMTISTLNRDTYTRLLRAHEFDAAVISFPTHKMFDPWSLFHSLAIDRANNFGMFKNAEIDALIDALNQEGDTLRRSRLMREITLAILAEHPGTFTFRGEGVVLAGEDVRGISFRNGNINKSTLYKINTETHPGKGNR